MSSHSSYTHTQKSKLPTCGHWTIPSLCFHPPIHHRTTQTWWCSPLSTGEPPTPQATETQLSHAGRQRLLQVCTTHRAGKRPPPDPTETAGAPLAPTSTAKIWPAHGANIHAFTKGTVRSVLASSTWRLETQRHTLPPKYCDTKFALSRINKMSTCEIMRRGYWQRLGTIPQNFKMYCLCFNCITK